MRPAGDSEGEIMADEQVCFRCGTTEALTFGPDPYNSDVNDDDTDVWECDRCRQDSADDI